jgi:peptidyl-prolyl cis-trans isomerase B (cyclophilin B)
MIRLRLRSSSFALGSLVVAGAILAGCAGLGGQTSTIISTVGEPITPAPSTAAAPSAAAPSAAAGACPTSQPAALPAGEQRTVMVDTPKGAITMEIDADLSPIAAGNFVALAECGYYDDVVFHRLVPGFVIQGGDGEFGKVGADGKLANPDKAGTGGPGYTIKDEPVTTKYQRGTVAMARTPDPDSVGSQFFIVLDDGAAPALAQPGANNYQIIGTVTAGMEVVDTIAAMPNSGQNSGNAAIDPVPMTKVTVSK